MLFSTLTSLLFAAPAAASPVKRDTAPATDLLVIRAWNTTTFTCDLLSPHLYVEMSPAYPLWGAVGNYDSYSLSRDLAANETLQIFGFSDNSFCGTLLYPISGIKQGCCHTTVTNQTFSCMNLVTGS